MKKLLLFALFSAFGMATSLAQDFAPLGSEWHYTNIESFFSPNQGYEKITSVADTLIQGKPSKHLKSTLYTTWMGPHPQPDVFLHTSGDTVFKLAPDGNFYVLYNFGAQVGDTWTSLEYDPFNGQNLPVTFRVDSLGTTMLNGQTLRQLWVHPLQGQVSYGQGLITEKLGGALYLFVQNYAMDHDDIRVLLRCYSDPSFGSYMSPDAASCTEMVTSVPDDVLADAITLYPNPVASTLQVLFPEAGQQVEVLNALGRVVARQTCAQNCELDVQALPQGLYLLRITDSRNRSRTERFVKSTN